ncbi:hypothetical protein NX862_19055 [Rhodobacter sp. KR11]|uniref:hypothetical protein n=1 Tax=Rhodobacter sp. KR11 TaxID=2974588 RepID=UPI00222229BC|nr:hypothetical protein [Rhodobacter sp. KR11]MCW1920862.1 hypothetical protein [Rhodobacter sp. KR11]
MAPTNNLPFATTTNSAVQRALPFPDGHAVSALVCGAICIRSKGHGLALTDAGIACPSGGIAKNLALTTLYIVAYLHTCAEMLHQEGHANWATCTQRLKQKGVSMAEPREKMSNAGADPGSESPAIFASVDRVNWTANWVVADHDLRNGALSDEEINAIAQEFDFSPAELRSLSVSLASALYTIPATMRGIAYEESTTKGAKAVRSARSQVSSVKKKLVAAAETIRNLTAFHGVPVEQRQLVKDAKTRIPPIIEAIDELDSALKAIQEIEGLAVLRTFVDQRQIPDERRISVMTAIFDFWHSQGRKVTYTTDPLNSERRGRIFAFVNAVVGSVTEPKSTFGTEAIVGDIRKWKSTQTERAKGFSGFVEQMQRRHNT